MSLILGSLVLTAPRPRGVGNILTISQVRELRLRNGKWPAQGLAVSEGRLRRAVCKVRA